MKGKISDDVARIIDSITIKDLLGQNIPLKLLQDSHQYDGIIYHYLSANYPNLEVDLDRLSWGHNFFKNQLNQAFILRKTSLKSDLLNPHFDLIGESKKTQKLTITNINPEELTLNSGHYISNRTTRAMFWEATNTGRTIEFHLGDSREFIKHVRQFGGEVVYEIKPLARNYNKQFLVKYPGDEQYRYAITNIGGADRLEHLVHSLSLTRLITKKELTNQVIVYGEILEYHDNLTAKFTEQLKILPLQIESLLVKKER